MARVLIVDDAALVREYHQQIVEPLGAEVEEAGNGVEAMEKALSADYDLYLVDINMPQMDGLSLTRELRRRPEIRQSPIVVVSTEAEKRDERAALSAGANLYLIKPVVPEALAGYVAILMGGCG